MTARYDGMYELQHFKVGSLTPSHSDVIVHRNRIECCGHCIRHTVLIRMPDRFELSSAQGQVLQFVIRKPKQEQKFIQTEATQHSAAQHSTGQQMCTACAGTAHKVRKPMSTHARIPVIAGSRRMTNLLVAKKEIYCFIHRHLLRPCESYK